MTTTNLTTDPLRRLLRHLAQVRDRIESDDVRRRADVLLSGARNLDDMRQLELDDFRVALQGFCYVNDLQEVLRASGVEQAYDYRQRYGQPPPEGSPVRVEATSGRGTLLGREIGFPIGVPASVLTANRHWVRFFAERGFNVLTFKTVRSRATDANDFPNWVFLEDGERPLKVGTDPQTVTVHGNKDTYLQRLRSFSTANSFGVPSLAPEEWMPEIAAAAEALTDDQMLIVSVMGSAGPDDPPEALLEDFVRVARMAADAGAPAIELNLSCPNTLDPSIKEAGVKPPLCESLDDTVQIVRSVFEEIGSAIPLVAKLGYLPSTDLASLVREINPYVGAISGINTLQVRVERRSGGATFGERQLAGLSGVALRRLALDFVRSLHALRTNEADLEYDIIGIGGVMDSADVYALLAVGADAVQTATAASVNPRLAAELVDPVLVNPEAESATVEFVRDLLLDESGDYRDAESLAARLNVPVDAVERELNPLAELDLPRRVFELMASGHVDSHDARELDPEVWGPGPTPERLAELHRATKLRLEQEQMAVLSRSMAPEDAAKGLGWPVADVHAALNDGQLVYLDWAGRRALPVWQFETQEKQLVPLPGISELRRAFARDVVALDSWITSPNPALGGDIPRDVLRAGEADRVLASLVALGSGR
jgi:dihydroorotate dehydrogenase